MYLYKDDEGRILKVNEGEAITREELVATIEIAQDALEQYDMLNGNTAENDAPPEDEPIDEPTPEPTPPIEPMQPQTIQIPIQ